MFWFITCLILFTFYLFLIAPSFRRRKLPQQKYAHRGFHTQDQIVKENGMDAFKKAVEKGYGIELDVQLSQDHQVVIYHDDTLERLDNDTRLVYACTFAELQGFQLPLLTDVLATVDGKIDLIVELKTVPSNLIDPFCQIVYDILKTYHGSYCIESFNPFIVAWFKKNAPDVTRGQLIGPIKDYPNFWQGLFLNSLVYQVLTRPDFIAFSVESTRFNPALLLNKLMGAQFVLWTVRDPKEIEGRGVDAVIFEYFDFYN